jgi:ketosteroid isomerase-like protein
VSDNLDLVRSIYAAWGRRDYTWTEWADPAIDFVVVGGPSPGHWTGLAGMWRGWQEILSAWDDWRAEEIAYRELDAERILVTFRLAGRGKISGFEASQLGGRAANVFHFDEGVATKLVVYWDADRALADLGMEE